MARSILVQAAVVCLGGLFLACGGSESASGNGNGGAGGSSGTSSGSGGSPTGGAGANGGSAGASSGGSSGIGGSGGSTSSGGSAGTQAGASGKGGSSGGGSTGMPTCDELPGLIDAYKSAHPGSDGDINAKTASELDADPEAQRLMSICGADQRPIIPLLAWEYGGSDHAWINPEESALAYCVYTPVDPATEHWSYDETADHVEADVTIVCPDQNPCNDEVGADQVMACLGDDTNIEIIVDTASFNDGMDVGFDLSEASTDLNLVMPDDSKVHLYTGT